MAKSCKGCYYWRPSASYSKKTLKICHYMLDTGEPRNCPAEKCNKKETGYEHNQSPTKKEKKKYE